MLKKIATELFPLLDAALENILLFPIGEDAALEGGEGLTRVDGVEHGEGSLLEALMSGNSIHRTLVKLSEFHLPQDQCPKLHPYSIQGNPYQGSGVADCYFAVYVPIPDLCTEDDAQSPIFCAGV